MELKQIQYTIYQPKLDIDTGKYIDDCPIPPYNRNKGLEYHCLCNNSKFYTMSEYKKHIKLKSHERFLNNYIHYINDLEHAKQQAIEYRTLYEITHRKLLELTKLYEFDKEMANVD
jgi:hypothetical protein